MRSKNIFLIAALGLLLFSCGSPTDDQTRLLDLKKQYDNLNKEIKVLEKKILSEGGSLEADIKIPAVVGKKMEAQEFSHFIEVRGNVESDNNIFVPALRPYLVKKILVREGDQVTKGQLMAELDNESISQTIKEIKNGLQLATTLFERQENLWEKNIGTEVQYLQAKTGMEDLKIKLKSAETELDNTRIYSPIDGIVDLVVIKEGEAAPANQGAIRVSNLSSQKIVAKISESYITDIRKNDHLAVYFPTIDLSFETTISVVSRVIDRNNRTFDIEVKLPDDDRINPNMLAILTISDYFNPQAMVLPVNAVQRMENRNYVFVAKKQNKLWVSELRDVETGKFNHDKVEITNGLMDGDVVITFGYNNISVGDPVQVNFTQF